MAEKYVCDKTRCTGCGACVWKCPQHAISMETLMFHSGARMDSNLCCDCGACQEVCQIFHPLECRKPVEAWQGWAADNATRMGGSSGGIAGALCKAFLLDGGVVCACKFQQGKFAFAMVDSAEDFPLFAGSKYVKSDSQGLYSLTFERLKRKQRILVIGLPCQIAGLQRAMPRDKLRLMYTVDLICHGTPSVKLLEEYAASHNCPLGEIGNISFREKDTFHLRASNVVTFNHGAADAYTLAFLNGISYTENCYRCAYARYERVSDLTIGDSWGSELPDKEKRKGISLLLCQTEKGNELLRMANLHLESVDIQKAVQSNGQLNDPVPLPPDRNAFLKHYESCHKLERTVRRFYPLQYYRQKLKGLLLASKIWKGGGTES